MTTLALHHILLKSPLLAADVLQELHIGADFSELAEEYSACPSAHHQRKSMSMSCLKSWLNITDYITCHYSSFSWTRTDSSRGF